MPDYTKTKIYRLVSKNPDILECYVGSTTNFNARRSLHKSDCNISNAKRYNSKKYIFIRENGGWSEWEMVLIEEYACENYEQARKRELYWQEHYSASLNENRAYVNIKEEAKKYYIKNADEITLRLRKKYAENDNNIKDKKHQYYTEHAEKYNQYQKQKYAENKEQIKQNYKQERISCECGSSFNKVGLANHLKCQKHIDFSSSKS